MYYHQVMSRDSLVHALRAVLTTHPLRLAVLFGSAARDAMRADSDVDVGILARDPEMSLADELALQAALERATSRTVDLVRLEEASILLRWRIAREGVAILADPPYEWTRFVARAGIDHADFAPLYARTAEAFRRKVAAGEGGT